ncbi:UDP-N-acetylmuramoyl-L-alanyl-D-glutamate--2,6-diaminopimelate ligase [Patescibacteria group bacterium]
MLNKLKRLISDTNPLRLFYHQIKAVIAVLVYGFPSKNLNVIGVTGTNGKTTTVNLITMILEEAGHKVGMASTINFQIGASKWTNATKQTTMSPFTLQKMLRDMVKEGCTHAVLEVSSHAITQSRILGVNFDTAAFTNVTEDHIEYHGSFQMYLQAKGSLFKRLNKSKRKPNMPKVSVLNQDDPQFAYFDQFIVDRKYTYSLKRGTCYATDIDLYPGGSTFTLHVPNNEIEVELKLSGEFNIYNALAAATVALANNINVQAIKNALEKAQGVAGRLEVLECGQPYSIVVDYAHAPDALQKLLELYKKLTPGRVFAVFGATGGGRDKAKRPTMGQIADEFADYIILTNDDPYEEDEWKIIEGIAEGIKRKEGDRFWKIPHRYEAIRLALTLAKEGDSVIIAGKGCEEIQIIGKEKIPWDDRHAVRELLSRDVVIEIGEGKTESKENVCLEG